MSLTGEYSLIVDDKTRPREWGVNALERVGFDRNKMVLGYFGDDALAKYLELRNNNKKVGLVLTDYHMDVRRKPPQNFIGCYRRATLFSGMDLAKRIMNIDPSQRVCMVTAGLNKAIIDEADSIGIPLVLYKRRPEDAKFPIYIEAIRHYCEKGNLPAAKLMRELLPATIWTPNGSQTRAQYLQQEFL